MIFESVDPRELKIDSRELAARLGTTLDFYLEGGAGIYESLLLAAKPMYIAKKVKLSRQNDVIYIENAKANSRALLVVCNGYDECVLLCATLGVGVDRLILKTSGTSAHDAFVMDAMADALIEALCDYAEKKCTVDYTASGRFSPGYADLDLSFGKEILILTDAERMLGIKLTESGLMLPKKSVNAIIAIK